MYTDIPFAVTIKDIFDSAESVKTFILDIDLNSKPGQFVMLWLPGIDEKPFSIARDENGELWLTICAVGNFTEKLFMKKPGDKLGLRGPFGKGYRTAQKSDRVVLVGGGYGMAPLHNCGTMQQTAGAEVIAITGARSEKNVLFVKECETSGFRTFVTTDDGTLGETGFVTTVLKRLLTEEKINLVQTCGPEKMMRAVAELCGEKNVACEVSIERYMKCGFGVCGQCVVEGTGECMCVEGPVVDGAHALKNFPDFGISHRGAEGQKVLW